ncbi:MAG: hypothetical protein HQL07_04790 [Nitrospirae bacterium]|nr:hypothetical protein [Magnetococcales bacterium]HAT50159.1 hypothetical protein [Alphaproteobacteria bacterium]
MSRINRPDGHHEDFIGEICSHGLRQCFSEISSDSSGYESLNGLECLKHRVIQFFSVDIVDSTAMKQAGQETGDWMNPVVNFFGQINHSFDRAWDRAKKNLEWIREFDNALTIGPAPEFFKGNGDEAIFQKELRHPAESLYLLHALRDEISQLAIYKPGSQEKHLQYKVSSWIASFPVPNRQIVLQQRQGKQAPDDAAFLGSYILRNFDLVERYYEDRLETQRPGANLQHHQDIGLLMDYVGPGLDTGFRVSSLANSSRLTLSLELAQILAATHSYITKSHQQGVAKEYRNYIRNRQHNELWSQIPALELLVDFDIFLFGFQSLKGVLKGIPFPVFWIPAQSSDLNLMENEALSKLDWCELSDFANEFIERNKDYLYPVYIPNDSWKLFSVLGPEQERKRSLLIDSIFSPIKKRKIEAQVFSEDDDAKAAPDQIVEHLVQDIPLREKW